MFRSKKQFNVARSATILRDIKDKEFFQDFETGIIMLRLHKSNTDRSSIVAVAICNDVGDEMFTTTCYLYLDDTVVLEIDAKLFIATPIDMSTMV